MLGGDRLPAHLTFNVEEIWSYFADETDRLTWTADHYYFRMKEFIFYLLLYQKIFVFFEFVLSY